MLSLAEFTAWLGAVLEVLEGHPTARKDFVAGLKEWGLVMEPADEDDLMPSEMSQDTEGGLEPDVVMVARLARLEQLPAAERERVLKSWTPEERQKAMDELGGPVRFLALLDRSN